MSVGKIAVLRSPLEALVQGLEAADVPSPFAGERWKGYRGANGGVFHAAALDGGALVVPFGLFETREDVALAVRGVLGPALDRHDEARGLFISDADAPPEGAYGAAVEGAGAFVTVPPPDDSRLAKEAGWSFAAAASAFSSPEAKKRVEEHTDADPFAAAASALDSKLAARDDRGALRRTLSVALQHDLEHDAGKAPAGGEDERVLEQAAEQLLRAVSPSASPTPAPDKIDEMEKVLRNVVDKDLARPEVIDVSKVPQAEGGDETEESKAETD